MVIHLPTVNAICLQTTALIYLFALGAVAVEPVKTGWTESELTVVADAAIVSAKADKNNAVVRLIELSVALHKAGDDSLARESLLTAVPLIDVPHYARNISGHVWVDGQRGTLIEKLAQLGAGAVADKLAAVEVQPTVKIALLGNLGSGYAGAGNIQESLRVADSIAALKRASNDSSTDFADAVTSAISDVASALAKAGAIDDSLRLATPLPNGIPKAESLSQAAHELCKGKKLDLLKGGEVADQVATSASLGLVTAGMPYDKVRLMMTAGIDLAECKGASAAKAFVAGSAKAVLTDWGLAEELVQRQDIVTGHDHFGRCSHTISRRVSQIPCSNG
jgi:hypothetical protein